MSERVTPDAWPLRRDYLLKPQPDGTTDVLVTEEIVADFRRNGVNRGIVRAIPLTEDEVLFIRVGDARNRLARGRSGGPSHRLGDVALNSPDRVKQGIYLDANGTAGPYPSTGWWPACTCPPS